MPYTIAVCSVKSPDDGQRNSPKHVEFHSKNKFEKSVHLVGLIIRNHSRTFAHFRTRRDEDMYLADYERCMTFLSEVPVSNPQPDSQI